jgi:hypothetical protein
VQYKNADHYKEAMKKSGKFRKENDYEVFSWNICMECHYFKKLGKFNDGECRLMEKEGAYNGVMATAVCNRYLNKRGFDINGKVIIPGLLPKWIKTRKNKNGEIFIKG